MKRARTILWLSASAVAMLANSASQAGDINWKLSGFGTVSYAISDSETNYLRSINKRGTFRNDTIAGIQLDGSLDTDWGRFGATVQGVAKASDKKETGLDPSLSWAFLSYRPDNDWQFRLGKFRPPVFINIQNMEVGTTYDAARLAPEVYGMSPLYDLIGGSASRSWSTESGEYNIEGYIGTTSIYLRGYNPVDDVAIYNNYDLNVAGAVLSYQTEDLLLRGGYTRMVGRPAQAGSLYYGNIEPSMWPDGTLYVPTGGSTRDTVNLFSIGFDWNINENWRVTSEYVRMVDESSIGVNGQGAYVTLSHKIGDFVPYVGVSAIRSDDSNLKIYNNLKNTPVPLSAIAMVPGMTSTYHQLLASTVPAYDQVTLRVGSAYNFSPTAKIKAEWAYTHVGETSGLFDDANTAGKDVNVFTVSFSKSF